MGRHEIAVQQHLLVSAVSNIPVTFMNAELLLGQTNYTIYKLWKLKHL